MTAQNSLDFAEALRRCEYVGEAAELCLERMLALIADAIAGGDWKGAQLERAFLHLRPGHTVRGLFVLEPNTAGVRSPRGGETLLPSLSAWGSVRETGRGAALDVAMGAVTPRGRETESAPRRPSRITDQTKARLELRAVTHLYVAPLPAPTELVGMVSVELYAPEAMGSALPWDAVSEELELLATLSGPYLAALPRKPEPARRDDPLLPVVGSSMAGVVDVLGAFATEPETLLIRGETGVGKSRIARWCHARSELSGGPFEVLDLLSVPEEMQMGELFGWKRGAFTGAASDHAGFVGRAEGGTLFLDEIDKLSAKAQAALLVLLEERRYRVLGSQDVKTADVRFVVGTNADLPEEVRAGRFREDLFYRINVLPVELPALRNRRDEIPEWARFMLERRHEDRGGKGSVVLDDRAAELLSAQDWPGNLRQLDNIVRRAHAIACARSGADAVRLLAEHVQSALGLDASVSGAPTSSGDGLTGLRTGASALVAELAKDQASLSGVDLPRALHGVVLAEAVLRTGSREAAFELIGRGELVANRNHHKALRRDLGHARDLYAAFGKDPPDDLDKA
ncbi:MAG: sigma-54-dependent transcriptional regulator [Sandaracinaceae bacterium]